MLAAACAESALYPALALALRTGISWDGRIHRRINLPLSVTHISLQLYSTCRLINYRQRLLCRCCTFWALQSDRRADLATRKIDRRANKKTGKWALQKVLRTRASSLAQALSSPPANRSTRRASSSEPPRYFKTLSSLDGSGPADSCAASSSALCMYSMASLWDVDRSCAYTCTA